MQVKGVNGNWVLAKDYWLLWGVLLLLPFSSYAGGLGNAVLLAIIGFAMPLGRPLSSVRKFINKMPWVIFALLGFLLWAWISSFWSPYESGKGLNNATKIMLGVPVYLACAYVIKQISFSEVLSQSLLRVLWATMMIVGVMICVDQLSGYALNFALYPPDPSQDINLRIGDTMQNIGHGTSILCLFLPILLGYLAQTNPFTNKTVNQAQPYNTAYMATAWHLNIWQWGILLLVLIAALLTGQNASALAAIVVTLTMWAAIKNPRLMIQFCFGFVWACLAFAPILAWVSQNMSPNLKSKLPFSWEERVDNWGYLYGKITESPWVGHGFDAVRTFNETRTIRGFDDRAIVSMHPHNAGLHIWVETGLVGIALASFALFLAYQLYINWAERTSRASLKIAALCGVMIASAVMASFSYGVWQDWWWASIIAAVACVFLVPFRKTGRYKESISL